MVLIKPLLSLGQASRSVEALPIPWGRNEVKIGWLPICAGGMGSSSQVFKMFAYLGYQRIDQ